MILISLVIDVERDLRAPSEVLNLRSYSLLGSNYKQKYPVPVMKSNMNLAVIHGTKDEVIPYLIVKEFARKFDGTIFPINDGKHHLRDIFPMLEETFKKVSSNMDLALD